MSVVYLFVEADTAVLAVSDVARACCDVDASSLTRWYVLSTSADCRQMSCTAARFDWCCCCCCCCCSHHHSSAGRGSSRVLCRCAGILLDLRCARVRYPRTLAQLFHYSGQRNASDRRARTPQSTPFPLYTTRNLHASQTTLPRSSTFTHR